MAKSIISTGTVANDGTGDTIRAAMTKVNDNFTEVYDALGDGLDLKSFGVNMEAVSTNDGRLLYFNGVENTLNGAAASSLIVGEVGINGVSFKLQSDTAPSTGSSVVRFERARGVIVDTLIPNDPLPINGDEVLGVVQARAFNNSSSYVESGNLSWTATTNTGDANFSINVRYGASLTEMISSFGGKVRVSGAYTLPNTDGAASGDCLTTDGAGTASWVANISLAQFKAVVAASTDFLDFQTRVAAL